MKRISLIGVILAAFILSAVWVAGCEKSYRDKEGVKDSEKEVPDRKPKPVEIKKAEPAAEQAGDKTAADDEQCFGKENADAPTVTFEANGVQYELKANYRLYAKGADGDKELKIGVITDLKTDIPKNIVNLRYFFEQFKAAGVDAVVVTGDSSETYKSLKNVFTYLGKQGYLTLIIMGNRDKKEAYTKALHEVQGTYKNLVDMNRVRLADLGPATLLSLPGYYDANYIHHRPGCEYGPMQLDVVAKLATGIEEPMVLISHGPPRGEGKTGIDFATEAGNVGDPRMTELILKAKIPFGIFGNIHEAGGHAVGADMKTVLNPGAFYKNVYLNPGPADSDPWNMNDESISRGMAGIMTIKDGQASFQILRITAEQQQQMGGPSEAAKQQAKPMETGKPKVNVPKLSPNAPKPKAN